MRDSRRSKDHRPKDVIPMGVRINNVINGWRLNVIQSDHDTPRVTRTVSCIYQNRVLFGRNDADVRLGLSAYWISVARENPDIMSQLNKGIRHTLVPPPQS